MTTIESQKKIHREYPYVIYSAALDDYRCFKHPSIAAWRLAEEERDSGYGYELLVRVVPEKWYL